MLYSPKPCQFKEAKRIPFLLVCGKGLVYNFYYNVFGTMTDHFVWTEAKRTSEADAYGTIVTLSV